MADPRFYSVAGPIKLKQLAEAAEAKIGNGANPESEFVDIRPLSDAGPDHLSFLDNKKYLESFSKSRAGASRVMPCSS